MKLDFTALELSVSALGRSVAAAIPIVDSLDPALRETVKAGVIQHFEVAYEQSWKAMKRWLENNLDRESVDGVTRRELFRLAAENLLIDDVDRWMSFHRGRNETTHTDNAETSEGVFAIAREFVPAGQQLLGVIRQRND